MDPAEITKLIVDRKLEFLKTVGDTSMLWWVSVVVFCGTILGVVLGWKKKLKGLSSRVLKFFSFIIFVFFASIVGYGFLIVNYASKSHEEIRLLLAQIKVSPNSFDHEYNLLYRGVLFGISSFILTLIAWVFISIWFISKKRKKKRKKT